VSVVSHTGLAFADRNRGDALASIATAAESVEPVRRSRRPGTTRAQKRMHALDRKVPLADREGMIHASAAQYYWFSFPIIRADGGTRVV